MFTLGQERAQFAMRLIDNLKERNREINKKEYGSRVRSLSSMIKNNGLGQTLAFIKAKGKGVANDPDTRLYRDLSSWLHKKYENDPSKIDFLPYLVNQDSLVYFQITEECLQFLIWLRRFVEAEGWVED
jgi:CRISPR-associated protein Cmr5